MAAKNVLEQLINSFVAVEWEDARRMNGFSFGSLVVKRIFIFPLCAYWLLSLLFVFLCMCVCSRLVLFLFSHTKSFVSYWRKINVLMSCISFS